MDFWKLYKINKLDGYALADNVFLGNQEISLKKWESQGFD